MWGLAQDRVCPPSHRKPWPKPAILGRGRCGGSVPSVWLSGKDWGAQSLPSAMALGGFGF